MLKNLKPGCHQMGQSFDNLAYGAAMGLAGGYLGE